MNLLMGLELSLLFVCIWGFIAVLITGQFNSLVILGCIAALVIGYRARRSGWRPNALIANIAAILVFLISGGVYLGTFNLLIATVYLFLFLQVTKYVTRQKLSESRWCYLISLFNVIGASVITTAITFGFVLVVYVFLTLISLRLYVMAREWESSLPPGANGLEVTYHTFSAEMAHGADYPAGTPGKMPRRMMWSALFLTFLIMIIASGIFSAIPRLATQNLFQTYGPPQEEPAVSAFSENVEFGAFTEIHLDDAVALFVQPQEKERPSAVRMRGVALDTFNGKAWSRTGTSVRRESTFDFRPIFTTHRYPNQYIHRVIQPPGTTNFLFGDSFPLQMEVPRAFPFFVDFMAQTVYLQDMPPKEFQYTVVSMHEDLSQRQDPATMSATHRPVSHLTLDHNSYPFSGFRSGIEPDETEISPDDEIISDLLLEGEALPADSETWRLFTGDHLDTRTEETPASITVVTEEATAPDDPPGIPWRPAPWLDAGRPSQQLALSPEAGERWRQAREEFDSPAERQDHMDGANDRPTTTVEFIRRLGYGRGRFYRMNPQQMLRYYLSKCLALPETLSSGRIAELAEEWTADAETTFTKAREIERRLRTEYGYSLTPQARGNYIESFLFDVREGHCEYFATSMAILLRNIGIPARVVNGYYSTEWNGLSGMFTVRQRDAHSWIEVWLGDEYGWMTFDPTPPSGVARRGDLSALAQTLSRLSDAVRMRWYRYVVDYSLTDQVGAVRQILQWRRSIMNALKQMDILGISSDDERQVALGEYTREIDWRPIAISGGIIILLLTWQISRWIGRHRAKRYSSVAFYDKLLRSLAKQGFTIKQGQTPREFALQVAAERKSLRNLVIVTEEYYATKFKNKQPGPELQHIIAQLRHELRRKSQN